MNDKRREYEVTHEAEEEARHSMGVIVWIFVAIVVVVLGAIVLLTVKSGTFCTMASLLLCGMAVFAATAKRVR